MTTTLINHEYNYALVDLLEQPPLSHLDMVLALGRGEFIIEGAESNYTSAQLYADHHSESKEVWDGMQLLDFEGID